MGIALDEVIRQYAMRHRIALDEVIRQYAMRHNLSPEEVLADAAMVLSECGERVSVHQHLDLMAEKLKDRPEMLTLQAFVVGVYLGRKGEG